MISGLPGKMSEERVKREVVIPAMGGDSGALSRFIGGREVEQVEMCVSPLMASPFWLDQLLVLTL